jgi:FkbM family methyltransferase
LLRVLRKIALITRLSFSLGATFGSSCLLWYAALRRLIGRRASIARGREYKLKLKYKGKTFDFYFGSYSDFVVLKEVFLDNEYEMSLGEEPGVIFDLGSHVGASVIYFRLKYPGAKIYAFEPDPTSFAKLQRHTGQFDEIIASNIAVSGRDGREKFFIHSEDSVSSSLVQREPGQACVEVECRTLGRLMRDLGISKIDLLKMDIEGGEYNALRDFDGIVNVKHIICELHLDLIEHNLEEFLRLFNGFKVSKEKVKQDRYIIRASRD